jgi:hypothetical protein
MKDTEKFCYFVVFLMVTKLLVIFLLRNLLVCSGVSALFTPN